MNAVQNTSIPDPSSFWKPPAGATKKDGVVIVDWFKANDDCVGGEDPKVYEPRCKIRDSLQDRLRKRGWCWGAPMAKSAADDDWHRCGTYDSDNMSNGDADVQRAMNYLHKDDAKPDATTDSGERYHPIVSPTDPHSGDWYNEQHRPKSALLQAYENAEEKIDHTVALADILAECGIRGEGWHQQVLALANSRRHDPSLEEMRQRLSSADAASAAKFDQIVISGNKMLLLGPQPTQAACQSVANMPWATNDALFE